MYKQIIKSQKIVHDCQDCSTVLCDNTIQCASETAVCVCVIQKQRHGGTIEGHRPPNNFCNAPTDSHYQRPQNHDLPPPRDFFHGSRIINDEQHSLQYCFTQPIHPLVEIFTSTATTMKCFMQQWQLKSHDSAT